MQSTGQTDTHEMSSTSMHGSAITYVIQFLLDAQTPDHNIAADREGTPGGGPPGSAASRHSSSGTPSAPTHRTGTAIPFSRWPGMWHARRKPGCDGPSAGTCHVTSTRSPDRAVT